jgi:ubiquinone/menaquinone biosynthesis C-methylase UbiE
MALSAALPRPVRTDPARRKAELAYDLAADHYDRWAWQSFWRENEFPIVLDQLLSARPKRAVLDIGIGTGAFLSYAAPSLRRPIRLVGVDLSRRMLQHARSRLGSQATLVQCDVRNGLPFRNGSFDSVLMMRVANHLPSLDAALAEIARVLSPRGRLIATDLAEEFDYVCTRIPTPDMKIDIETYKHSQTDWRRALRSAGFSAIRFSLYKHSDLRNASAGHLDDRLDHRNTPIFHVIEATGSSRTSRSHPQGGALEKIQNIAGSAL